MTDRCPGGYILHGTRMCGLTGNKCRDRCAFEHLRGTPRDQSSERLREAGYQIVFEKK